MSIKLEAKIRTITSQGAKKTRRSGFVPAVVYGQGMANINIAVPMNSMAKVLKEAGESTLLQLQIEGDGVMSSKIHNVLIHDIQTDPVKDHLSHVDFMEVRMDQKIKTPIALSFIGESLAIKELGGVLIKNIHELEVEALPQALPHHLEVDISNIKSFEDHITVANIKIGKNVKILAEGSLVVASVMPPRTEAELESLKSEVIEDISKVEGVIKSETTETEVVENKVEQK